MHLVTFCIVVALVIGCDDASSVSLPHGYSLSFTDIPEMRNLLDHNDVGRISAHIFEVGYNQEYIIVKQHPIVYIDGFPESNRSILNYFILRMEVDEISEEVWGPYDKAMFESKLHELDISELDFSIKYKVDGYERIKPR